MYWALDPEFRVRFPARAKTFTTSSLWILTLNKGSPTGKVTFSKGHAGGRRKSLNGAPWEMPSLGLSRPLSVPLLTAVLSRRHEEEGIE